MLTADLGSIAQDSLAILQPENMWLFSALVIWSLIWKGFALWHAAGRQQKIWFIILLILNTAGILEIIYLFFVAKVQNKKGAMRNVEEESGNADRN